MNNISEREELIPFIQKMRVKTNENDVLRLFLALINNSQRADAKKIEVIVNKECDTITIIDDGNGCNNPENVFNLYPAAFQKSLRKIFKEGFLQIFVVADYFSVESLQWKTFIDVESLTKSAEGPMELEIETNEVTFKGFKVSIKSKHIPSCLDMIIKTIKEESMTMPQINFVINGLEIK